MTEEIKPESTVSTNDIDALNDLFKNYDKPAEITGDNGTVQSVQNSSSNDFPWLSGNQTPSTPQVSNEPKPFITHNPAGSQPTQEYYVRGPKKGQPKPVSKNKAPIPPPTTIQASSFLTGAIFLTLLDIFVPTILVGLNNMTSKVKMKYDGMKLTDAQKKELEPVANAVLKEVNLNASPALLLGIAILGSYLPMFLVARSEAQAKHKINEKDKKVSFETNTKNDIRKFSNIRY